MGFGVYKDPFRIFNACWKASFSRFHGYGVPAHLKVMAKSCFTALKSTFTAYNKKIITTEYFISHPFGQS